MGSDALLFYTFAGVTVLGALAVVTQKNPVYSVLAIIASFFGLAGLYVLLEAPFVAVAQIIIYAGAIMGRVLFTDYMFAFEVTSILIIAAMVGAVVLARKREE